MAVKSNSASSASLVLIGYTFDYFYIFLSKTVNNIACHTQLSQMCITQQPGLNLLTFRVRGETKK